MSLKQVLDSCFFELDDPCRFEVSGGLPFTPEGKPLALHKGILYRVNAVEASEARFRVLMVICLCGALVAASLLFAPESTEWKDWAIALLMFSVVPLIGMLKHTEGQLAKRKDDVFCNVGRIGYALKVSGFLSQRIKRPALVAGLELSLSAVMFYLAGGSGSLVGTIGLAAAGALLAVFTLMFAWIALVKFHSRKLTRRV